MLGYEQVGMYSREYRYFREYPSLDPVPPQGKRGNGFFDLFSKQFRVGAQVSWGR